VTDVLARRDRALTPEETEELLRDQLGDGVLHSVQEYGVFTLWVAPQAWAPAVQACRDEPLLAYDLFDNLFAVDARNEGFDVVVVLYSTSTGNRIALRTRCEGGREAPRCPSITEVYRGADWMEREAWDMFGIEFPGHPAIEPRILTIENFEGWPLRKDFHLVSRLAKPWPGVKEPAETDEDGNVVHRVPQLGDAPGPYELDKAMAEQAKIANPLPVPETVEGEQVERAALESDRTEDTGVPLAGEVEQELEDDQKLTHEADVELAAQEAGGAEDEARRKADDRRREQVEARARRAAERAEVGQPADEDAPGASTSDGAAPDEEEGA
jgi:NADH:ubiquinone oxidoreductase subunit C